MGEYVLGSNIRYTVTKHFLPLPKFTKELHFNFNLSSRNLSQDGNLDLLNLSEDRNRG